MQDYITDVCTEIKRAHGQTLGQRRKEALERNGFHLDFIGFVPTESNGYNIHRVGIANGGYVALEVVGKSLAIYKIVAFPEKNSPLQIAKGSGEAVRVGNKIGKVAQDRDDESLQYIYVGENEEVFFGSHKAALERCREILLGRAQMEVGLGVEPSQAPEEQPEEQTEPQPQLGTSAAYALRAVTNHESFIYWREKFPNVKLYRNSDGQAVVDVAPYAFDPSITTLILANGEKSMPYSRIIHKYFSIA